MTTEQFLAKQESKLNAIIKENKPLLFAVTSTMALRSRRIFLQGLNADGGKIGDYGTNGLYVSGKARPSPKEPLRGKTGESKFKNGNEHKSKYFTNFLAYKKDVGRGQVLPTVDLYLTGDLHKNWSQVDKIAQAPKVNKLDANTYIEYLNDLSLSKISRYGNVFNISKDERKAFYKSFQDEFARLMKS